MHKVYLDHHTATRPYDTAVTTLLSFLKEHWGSTNAPHQMGQSPLSSLYQGTEQILSSLGAAQTDRFYFFSSGAEAISHLYLSHYFGHIRQTGKNHLLIPNSEDAQLWFSLKQLEELGCRGHVISVNEQGQLTKELLSRAILPRVSLLSISWANGLTGVIHPIADLSELCQERGILLHVDASHVLGKLYFSFQDIPIDFLTFEGSLVGAPKGTGGILFREKNPLPSPSNAIAGAHVGGICALATAIERNQNLLDHLCLETTRLRERFERGIQQALPNAQVLFQQVERLPHCTCIAFPLVASDALLYSLNRKGIYASLGGGSSQKLSHLLIGLGVDPLIAHCALSFALSFETTEKEIDHAIEVIAECVNKLKPLMP